MISPARRAIALFPACALLFAAHAGDWPTYRHDARRSGITADGLRPPLSRAWTYRCAQLPAPAWAPRVKLLNRTDYDYAPQLVVAAGIVCFGSSADDTIRALDAETGRLRWQFITGGPVRLAPQIVGERVYAAADDGHAYCLDARTGECLWTFRAAPRDLRLAGNRRIISRWPCRSGILVVDGVAYVVAGLWPSEGVYVYALDAADGTVQWVSDSLGYSHQGFHDSATGNHQGEFIMTGIVPEGALLTDGGVLLIPQGHAGPYRLDCRTGEPAAIGRERAVEDTRIGRRNYPGGGGTWVTIDDGNYYVMAMHRNRIIYLNRRELATGLGGGWRHSDRDIPQLTRQGLFRTAGRGRVSIVLHHGRIFARNAYDLILAGDSMVMGEAGAVVITSLDGHTEHWRGDVSGEARSLAVADERLFVATSTGEVSCFHTGGRAAGAAAPRQPTVRPAKLPEAQELAVAALLASRIDRGYVFVLGDASTRLARALAMRSQLHVVLAPVEARKVPELRRELLRDTAWYGRRIHVQTLGDNGHLPWAQYLANAVILVAPIPDLPATELYRLLRPCGGTLLMPGLTREQQRAVLTQIAPDDAEAQQLCGLTAVVRAPLEATNDWDRRIGDQHVRWPLRPLWFGGPDPIDLADDRSGEEFAKPPCAARGRYFVQGEKTMNGVDAYNGTVLWTRPMPKLWENIDRFDGMLRTTVNLPPEHVPDAYQKQHWRVRLARAVGADADHVYVRLGPAYLRYAGPATIRLDARTGEQVDVYAPWSAPPVFILDAPKAWTLHLAGDEGAPSGDVDALEAELAADAEATALPSMAAATRALDVDDGAVELRRDADGLRVRLVTRDADVVAGDRWDLFFDFRPRDRRFGLYDTGTFHTQVMLPQRPDGKPRVVPGSGKKHPPWTLAGARTAQGVDITLRASWPALAAVAGQGRLESFGFAVTLSADNGPADMKRSVRRRHLFGDARAAGINAGWATIVVAGAPPPNTPPAIVKGVTAPRDFWVSGAISPRHIDDSVAQSMRIHPLTGDAEPKIYRSGTWACGGPAFSSSAVFRRPSKPAIGVYDFVDDSGLRFIGGVSSPCGSSAVAALGLLLFSESRFRCDCNAPIRTSLALAPAERRLNEDWALFYDRRADTRIRQAALNFGVPGDRRDAAGRLWLAFPRPAPKGFGFPLAPGSKRARFLPGIWPQHVPATLQVPLTVDFLEGFGPTHVSADRIAIEATERPWLYASSISGIRRADLQLNLLPPAISVSAAAAPRIDGAWDWQGAPTFSLPFTKARIFVRHDDNALYIACRRPPVVDRKGKRVPWTAATRGDDADIWRDDSCEVFLADRRARQVLHLGVSASAARFDALARDGAAEERGWNGAWSSAVGEADGEQVTELAIPWPTLERAGLRRDDLAINVQVNQRDISAMAETFKGGEGFAWRLPTTAGEALCYLGAKGRERCENFAALGLGVAPPVPERTFTVRLFFAEIDDVAPGQRVFDVAIQGRQVLHDFDIVVAAGGVRRAVVREFRGIPATDKLVLEFSSHAAPSPVTVPLLSALEVRDEAWTVPGHRRR